MSIGAAVSDVAEDVELAAVGSCEAGAELEAALLGDVTGADTSVPELAALVAVGVDEPLPPGSVACRLQYRGLSVCAPASNNGEGKVTDVERLAW